MVLDVSPHDSSGRTLQSISYFLKANKSSNAAISQHFITLLKEGKGITKINVFTPFLSKDFIVSVKGLTFYFLL